MKLETLGHASMLIYNDKNEPLFLTDPWIIGSCYWRSWWIQNYPDAEKLELIKNTQYCYITHEHPDHYHIPSLRKLGDHPSYFAPDVPNCQIGPYLQNSLHFNVKTLPKFEWVKLTDEISICSLPTYSEDSALLINTPHALICNFNDTKPSGIQLKGIKEFLNKNRTGKKVILLSSYSPASPVNNFFRDFKRVNIKTKNDYIKRINTICDDLQVDYFMPFASQVIFHRSDTKWANEFKVKFSDLQSGWISRTTLLHPYTTIDLTTFASSFVNEEVYNHHPETYLPKVAEEEGRDKTTLITDEHHKMLQKKFNRIRFILMFLFPKGFGIKASGQFMSYKPWKGKIIKGKAEGHFVMSIPAHALIECLGDHIYFGDLHISMFTMIELDKRTDPRFIYGMFLLIEADDHFHFRSLSNLVKWVITNIRISKWNIPVLPV